MLPKHYLDQDVSKSELSKRFEVRHATIHHWVKTGQLERDLLDSRRRYSPRPSRRFPSCRRSPSYAVFLRDTGECLGVFDYEMEVAAFLAFEKLGRERVEVAADRPWPKTLAAWERSPAPRPERCCIPFPPTDRLKNGGSHFFRAPSRNFPIPLRAHALA